MYKIKIMNYQPYEYELLQQSLDSLGQQGYQCQELSLLSIFKKKNHPVYYHIDFFQAEGKTKFEKKTSKERFYNFYLEREYQPIYSKRGMYVFCGQKKLKKTTTHLEVLENIAIKRRNRSLLLSVLALFTTFFAAMLAVETYTIDSLLTYGITFVSIGLFLVLLISIYRQYINFFALTRFYKKRALSLITLKKLRSIFMSISILSIFFIGGGLIEDAMNIKTITPQEHTLIQFKDIGITEKSKLTYQRRSSFTVPYCYSSLESIHDDTYLLTKEYQLSSQQKAQNLWKEFSLNPKHFFCTKVEIKDKILYGYQGTTLTTLVFTKDKSVIMMTTSFELSATQINQIVHFYASIE